MISLDSLAVGAPGRVCGFDAALEPQAAQRLRELGLDEGASVTVVRRLMFGGPMIVTIGPVELALRPAEARLIRVAS